MPSQISPKTELALRLIRDDGMLPWPAAKRAQIAANTIYRALARGRSPLALEAAAALAVERAKPKKKRYVGQPVD